MTWWHKEPGHDFKMLQLQLQFEARDGCDILGMCVFRTHLTDDLTMSGHDSAADNCKRFTVTRYAKFYQKFDENGINLFSSNKQW